MKWIWLLLLVLLLSGIGWWWMSTHIPQSAPVTSFEACVKAGNPVMESYPRRCRSKDGSTFVERVEPVASTHPLITVSRPLPQALVASPLVVSGEAKGNWFFEGSFPVTITDEEGGVLGEGYATADGEWMTESFVPFSGSVSFTPQGGRGYVVFKKDNPSGLPEYDDAVMIPVRFSSVPTKTVRVYLYDASKDRGVDGSVLCSAKGLVPVERNIPVTETPLADTIRLLISEGATSEEIHRGKTTEFPLSGFALVSASIKGGVAELTFTDPENKTQGGSCRVGILRAQIEGTAKQFSGVNSVTIIPNTLFEP